MGCGFRFGLGLSWVWVRLGLGQVWDGLGLGWVWFGLGWVYAVESCF